MKPQDIDIVIDSVGRRGDGVGTHDGHPVFVPRLLAGEKARVRLEAFRDKGYAARLLNLLEKSPARTAAPCSHYDKCGGCALQHWEENAYRDWKASRVLGLLKNADVTPQVVLPPVFVPAATRRRATLAALVQNGRLQLGYHRARSHDVVNIPDCLVLTPRLQAAMTAMRPYLQSMLTPNKEADIFLQDTGTALDMLITGAVGMGRGADMAVREAMAAMAQDCDIARLGWRAHERQEPELMIQRAPVIKASGPLRVELPFNAFLQPSVEGEAALVDAVLAPFENTGRLRIADLFAGCGTFSGPLLTHGAVHAVDCEGPAIQSLKKAVVHGLTTEKRNLFAEPLSVKELNAYDAVVIDPPRMGAKEQAAALAKSDVPLVVSVSCNTSTFVRDTILLTEGGYDFESFKIVDQFVWSSHIELVGVFRRS